MQKHDAAPDNQMNNDEASGAPQKPVMLNGHQRDGEGGKNKDKDAVVWRSKKCVAMGALLASQMEKSKKGVMGDAALVGRLATQWAAVCPLLAPYCWPLRLTKGVLTIAVTSDPVKQELHYIAPTLIEAANMVAGYEAVRSVRYERAATAKQAQVKQAAKRLNAASEHEAKQVCERVNDPDMRVALTRLGAWLLDKRR